MIRPSLTADLQGDVGTIERIAAISRRDDSGKFVSALNNVKAFPPIRISVNSDQGITLSIKEVREPSTLNFIEQAQAISNSVPVAASGTKPLIDTGSMLLQAAFDAFTENTNDEKNLTFNLTANQIAALDYIIFYPDSVDAADVTAYRSQGGRIVVNGADDYIALDIEIVGSIFDNSTTPFQSNTVLKPFFEPFFVSLRELKGDSEQFAIRCSNVKAWAAKQFGLVDEDIAKLAIHTMGMDGAWYDPVNNNDHQRYNCFTNEDLRKYPFPSGFLINSTPVENECNSEACKASLQFLRFWKTRDILGLKRLNILQEPIDFIESSKRSDLSDISDITVDELRSKYLLRRYGDFIYNRDSTGVMRVNVCMNIDQLKNVPLVLEFGANEKTNTLTAGESAFSINLIELQDRNEPTRITC